MCVIQKCRRDLHNGCFTADNTAVSHTKLHKICKSSSHCLHMDQRSVWRISLHRIENKIENQCLLFPPIQQFILIMDQNIENNKNSALIPQYCHKFLWTCKRAYIKTDICEIAIYFCSFTIIEMLRTISLNVRWMLCILFFFYFTLCSKIFCEKVRKPANKKPKSILYI